MKPLFTLTEFGGVQNPLLGAFSEAQYCSGVLYVSRWFSQHSSSVKSKYKFCAWILGKAWSSLSPISTNAWGNSTCIIKHCKHAAAAAKLLQSRPTLCDPIDGSPSGSSAPGILKARTLEWVAISFSNAWKWKVNRKSLSRVRLLVTPWAAAHQAPPSMGVSRQEYWSGLIHVFNLFCLVNFQL